MNAPSSSTRKTIREIIGGYIAANYSGSLPIRWENMPGGDADITDGWIHLEIGFTRFDRVGIWRGSGGGGVAMQHGRVRLIIGVASGHGTATIDSAIAEMTQLIANRELENIRMGAARLTRLPVENGYHRIAMEVGFIAPGNLQETP